MINLDNLLKENTPSELSEFISTCVSSEDLIEKLVQNSSQLTAFLQNMKFEGNESFATRLLYQVNSNHPEVKKMETVLRNRGLLNRTSDPDFSLKVEGSELKAHKTVLGLESPYFRAMQGFKEFQEGKLEMIDTGISQEAYQLVLDYLYLSNEQRKEFNIEKSLLFDVAKLADFWGLDTLKEKCDHELCSSLEDISLDIEDWLAQAEFLPKFTRLLKFINRVAEEEKLEAVIEKMQTPEGVAELATKCTPEEISTFATLDTVFGKQCLIPEGAFGKVEWEKAFPVTIQEVPPLPENIHAILEQEDPWEPEKKLKETCLIFLRPEKVIVHDEEGDRELTLTFDGVEELAKRATNPERRTLYYNHLDFFRLRMNQMPAKESGWVLMRKEIIPGSRDKSFQEQKQLLKGKFNVPKLMDAILLNVITFAHTGICLYGRGPRAFTRCQETYLSYQTSVGSFRPSKFEPSEFEVFPNDFDDYYFGLAGAWKF